MNILLTEKSKKKKEEKNQPTTMAVSFYKAFWWRTIIEYIIWGMSVERKKKVQCKYKSTMVILFGFEKRKKENKKLCFDWREKQEHKNGAHQNVFIFTRITDDIFFSLK